MSKEKIIEQIVSILERIEDEKVLNDMLNIIRLIYNNYKLGN